MNLRAWLRKSPRPAIVMVGKTAIAVPDSRTKWAEVEETITATAEDGDKLVCLDASRNVLRAFTFDGGTTETAEPAAAKSSSETELVLLARELNNAADNGAKRHETAYAKAFEEIVSLCKTISERLGSMEQAWQKAMISQAKAQADMIVAVANAKAAAAGADTEQSDLMKMLGPLMPAILGAGGGHDSPSPSPPNGKKT